MKVKRTVFQAEKAVLLASGNGCSVYRFENETGEGTMTVYEVFHGIIL